MKIHWVDIDLYRTEVGFILGAPLDKYNKYMEKFGESPETDCEGMCSTLKARNGHKKYIVYVERLGDYDALAHEIYHCTNRILTDRGALEEPTDDEQGAYLCGYLTGKAMRWFK
jgi:hypothetical protein